MSPEVLSHIFEPFFTTKESARDPASDWSTYACILVKVGSESRESVGRDSRRTVTVGRDSLTTKRPVCRLRWGGCTDRRTVLETGRRPPTVVRIIDRGSPRRILADLLGVKKG